MKPTKLLITASLAGGLLGFLYATSLTQYEIRASSIRVPTLPRVFISDNQKSWKAEPVVGFLDAIEFIKSEFGKKNSKAESYISAAKTGTIGNETFLILTIRSTSIETYQRFIEQILQNFNSKYSPLINAYQKDKKAELSKLSENLIRLKSLLLSAQTNKDRTTLGNIAFAELLQIRLSEMERKFEFEQSALEFIKQNEFKEIASESDIWIGSYPNRAMFTLAGLLLGLLIGLAAQLICLRRNHRKEKL